MEKASLGSSKGALGVKKTPGAFQGSPRSSQRDPPRVKGEPQGVPGIPKDVPGDAMETSKVVLGRPGLPQGSQEEFHRNRSENGRSEIDVFIAQGNENAFSTNAVKKGDPTKHCARLWKT